MKYTFLQDFNEHLIGDIVDASAFEAEELQKLIENKVVEEVVETTEAQPEETPAE